MSGKRVKFAQILDGAREDVVVKCKWEQAGPAPIVGMCLTEITGAPWRARSAPGPRGECRGAVLAYLTAATM